MSAHQSYRDKAFQAVQMEFDRMNQNRNDSEIHEKETEPGYKAETERDRLVRAAAQAVKRVADYDRKNADTDENG